MAGFQSAPAIAGGRCTSIALPPPPLEAVSIRARHCWRAMRQQPLHQHGNLRFQSAPAIAGGRCEPTKNHASHIKVSIRARHCWRAMHAIPSVPAMSMVFQSAPAIAGGRCQRRFALWRRSFCFNPRPPLLAGDATTCTAKSLATPVSIRARHCWRAMQPV